MRVHVASPSLKFVEASRSYGNSKPREEIKCVRVEFRRSFGFKSKTACHSMITRLKWDCPLSFRTHEGVFSSIILNRDGTIHQYMNLFCVASKTFHFKYFSSNIRKTRRRNTLSITNLKLMRYSSYWVLFLLSITK